MPALLYRPRSQKSGESERAREFQVLEAVCASTADVHEAAVVAAVVAAAGAAARSSVTVQGAVGLLVEELLCLLCNAVSSALCACSVRRRASD